MTRTATLLLFALIGTSSLAQADELFKIVPADSSVGQFFGGAVAIDGSIALIGASNDDELASSAGAVYVVDALTGERRKKLLASDGGILNLFGSAVDLSGQLAVIGAAWDDDLGNQSGSAYLFDVGSGAQLFKLLASDGAPGDRLGDAVAIDGDRVLVGSRFAASFGVASGAVYVFDATNGAQLHELLPSDASASDSFGCSVAVDGSLAIVGSSGQGLSGAAYVFDVQTGLELLKIVPSDGAAGDEFGCAVAIRGDRVIVGARLDDDGFSSSGSAYIYEVPSGNLISKLTASDPSNAAWFGSSVGIDGPLAVVGAPKKNEQGPLAGACYLFNAASGAQISKLLPSDGEVGNEFANAVAIDDQQLLCGAHRSDSPLESAGSAYVFDAGLATVDLYCFGNGCPCGNDDPDAGCVNGTGAGARLDVSGSTSISQDDLVLLTQDLPANQPAVYLLFAMQGQAPFGNGLRCSGLGPTFRLHPAASSGSGGSLSLGPGIVSAACTSASVPCITTGLSLNFQVWYRDTQGPCGGTFNASNAATVTFTP